MIKIYLRHEKQLWTRGQARLRNQSTIGIHDQLNLDCI